MGAEAERKLEWMRSASRVEAFRDVLEEAIGYSICIVAV